MKHHVRLAIYNLRTCAVGLEGWLELALLVGRLSNLGIGLYGLQELHWLGEGECDIPMEGGNWSVLWLGKSVGR